MKRKNWVAFNNLSKNEKIFRVINVVLMLIMFVACIVLAFYYYFVYDPNQRLIPAICIAILTLFPILIEIIFGRRINNFIFLVIELYLLFAGFIGSVLNVYYLVWWYDIIIHIMMGYFVAIIGFFIAYKFELSSKHAILFTAIFCICFSLAVEVLWEIFEWGADNILNQTMQGEKIEGFNQPLVFDTMLDMVCNTIGALIFSVQYLIGKLSKCKMGIKFLENNFSNNYAKKNIGDKINTEKNVSEPTNEKIKK